MTEYSLFLDTSAFIQVGLLDQSNNWLSYELIKNKKGSQILHGLIFELLKSKSLSIKDIKRLVVANGPGSYTGIRLAEGLAQVLEIEGIEVINFYHFEVPSFLDSQDYRFVASAFKNEFFCYQRRNEEVEQFLISKEDFLELKDNSRTFHIGDDVAGRTFNSTYDLFSNQSVAIFSKVIERSTRNKPFYFRPLEKEFKISNFTA